MIDQIESPDPTQKEHFSMSQFGNDLNDRTETGSIRQDSIILFMSRMQGPPKKKKSTGQGRCLPRCESEVVVAAQFVPPPVEFR